MKRGTPLVHENLKACEGYLMTRGGICLALGLLESAGRSEDLSHLQVASDELRRTIITEWEQTCQCRR